MSETNPFQKSPVLIIQFAKWPQAGRVKTRLVPALGEQGAMEAHICLSLQVLDNLSKSGYPLQLWWDRPLDQPPIEAQSLLAKLSLVGAEQCFQSGENLGERMSRALAEGLTQYPRVIIVGSDCPSVNAGYIDEALLALEQNDVVLGPSDDGGYVLIGTRKVVPDMLANIQWGTDRALAETVERLTENKLTVALLETRWDVDEPDDWQRFLRESPGF
ncbi:TIGR04282 family arsenosugar biosynthesis glycosyltransferase [Marinobacter zhejiangensis]|uniref:Glycosyltransferase n=1 Tax=Marinobacter zhejiangensis TaxID=488535 RepID=A0A1I4QUD5_9GAMM|nr:TIGR04282 family arsenosugar biosynthesis glycosyltransferase [Marinobacter zhejiangensis]SFM43617.1 hypothetical protein SAMN04487963_2581 [Marinobacter zhejiangensis]